MYYFWLGLFLVIGLGYREAIALLFATTSVFALMVWKLTLGQRLAYPKLLGEYLLFLAIFLASTWWSLNQENTFLHWLLYASIPFIWIFATNHVEWLKKNLFSLVTVLGVLYLLLTIATQVFPSLAFIKTTPRGLVGTYSIKADHYMLGDFWVVPLMMLSYRFIVLKQKQWWPLISLGMAIVLFSLSRSALVSVGVGLWLLFQYAQQVPLRWKRFFWIGVAVIFIYMATQKSLLFNRPYYIQALSAVSTYPVGVGVANFELISKDSRFHLWGLSGFSRVTHSLPLEFLAGMGLLAAYFWWWCYRVYRAYFSPFVLTEFSLAIVALFVDFLFNPTYFVTPMVWLFFLLLPVATSQVTFLKKKKQVITASLLSLAGLFLLGGVVVAFNIL